MTKRRRRLLIGLVVLALGGVLALPAVHWRLYGWARGEPFWRGMPVSYHAPAPAEPAASRSSTSRRYGQGLRRVQRRARRCGHCE